MNHYRAIRCDVFRSLGVSAEGVGVDSDAGSVCLRIFPDEQIYDLAKIHRL